VLLHGFSDYPFYQQSSRKERIGLAVNFNSDKILSVENQQPDYNEPLYRQLESLKPEANAPAPNNPPWNSWMAVLVWAASVLFIIFVPSFGVLIYLALAGINLADSAKLAAAIQSDPTALLINIFFVIPAHILTLLLAWLVVTKARKYSFTEMLGWEWGGFRVWHLLLIVIGFFVFAGILGSLISEPENEFVKMLRSSRTIVYAVAFMATFSAPIVEEVIYRGVLYSAFQRTVGVTAAVILVTLLFAAVHVPQYYPSFVSIFVICLLSLVITLVRVKSGNLLPCIVLHFIFNGIQSALLIAEPYLRRFSEQPVPPAFFFLN
jgi:uncharacterized protein